MSPPSSAPTRHTYATRSASNWFFGCGLISGISGIPYSAQSLAMRPNWASNSPSCGTPMKQLAATADAPRDTARRTDVTCTRRVESSDCHDAVVSLMINPARPANAGRQTSTSPSCIRSASTPAPTNRRAVATGSLNPCSGPRGIRTSSAPMKVRPSGRRTVASRAAFPVSMAPPLSHPLPRRSSKTVHLGHLPLAPVVDLPEDRFQPTARRVRSVKHPHKLGHERINLVVDGPSVHRCYPSAFNDNAAADNHRVHIASGFAVDEMVGGIVERHERRRIEAQQHDVGQRAGYEHAHLSLEHRAPRATAQSHVQDVASRRPRAAVWRGDLVDQRRALEHLEHIERVIAAAAVATQTQWHSGASQCVQTQQPATELQVAERVVYNRRVRSCQQLDVVIREPDAVGNGHPVGQDIEVG